MNGVLSGFVVVSSMVVVGWFLARTGALGLRAQDVVSRLVFFVGSPALLLQTIAGTDIAALLSEQFVVTGIAVGSCVLLWMVAARFVFRMPRREAVVGGLSASMLNAANIGIPIAAYVLDDVAAVLPAMLLQMVLLVPGAVGLLDVTAPGRRGVALWRRLAAPMVNPVLIASVVGLVLSATSTAIPGVLAQPLDLLAGLAIPGALIAFGMSLHGMDSTGWANAPVLTAAALKSLVQPAVAYLVAAHLLGLPPAAVLATTVVAALPTAQNVFAVAVRYDVARPLARDTILVTTLVTGPVVLLVSLLLSSA